MLRQVIKTEMVIPFDIDGTLVMPIGEANKARASVVITDPYSKKSVLRMPHYPHIKLLRNYLARGAFVIVWSKNGNQWADAVLDALQIDHKNILVSTKPFAYVDDQAAVQWIGEHVNMPFGDAFGDEEGQL